MLLLLFLKVFGLILEMYYNNIIQSLHFFESYFPRLDTRPNQVDEIDPRPVTWPNLSKLIGCDQQIPSTSW